MLNPFIGSLVRPDSSFLLHLLAILHFVAAKESTVEQLEVKCGCKDEKTWCVTRHCACFKANVHCSVACHGGGRKDGEDGPECPNISTLAAHTQKGLKDRVEEGSKKRRRRDAGGKFYKKRSL